MDLTAFKQHMRMQLPVRAGSPVHLYMVEQAFEAMRITSELNGSYHDLPKIREIMSRLIGAPVPESFAMFPPFYTDFGKNITLGEHVFINSGCHFQDQGGITIGDRCLIGHGVVMASLNHDLRPEHRVDTIPAPIVLEANVWVGANATILAGVTIGENAVIAAGAVVTKSVPANTVVGGVPAKMIRPIE